MAINLIFFKMSSLGEIKVEYLLIGLGVLILLIAIVVFFLIRSKKSREIQLLLEVLEREKADRFRESESLKNEIRSTTKILQDQFFQVNRTIDTKLSESSKQLNERIDKSSRVIGSLQKELGKMGEIGAKIETLDKILRAPKGRGAMGEESLEEILRSVFPANLWQRQYQLGKVGVVDAIVKTSNGLIPIDAKFPLSGFEKLVNAENEEEANSAKKEFIKDVKLRINEVAKYILPEQGTLNFAILFLPNENIYYEATIRTGEIAEYAKNKKVLLTGPNTMVYILQMLFQAYQSQKFAEKAREALSYISGVKNQALKLDKAIEIVEKHIGNAGSQLSNLKKENQKLQKQIDRVQLIEENFTEDDVDQEKLI